MIKKKINHHKQTDAMLQMLAEEDDGHEADNESDDDESVSAGSNGKGK